MNLDRFYVDDSWVSGTYPAVLPRISCSSAGNFTHTIQLGKPLASQCHIRKCTLQMSFYFSFPLFQHQHGPGEIHIQRRITGHRKTIWLSSSVGHNEIKDSLRYWRLIKECSSLGIHENTHSWHCEQCPQDQQVLLHASYLLPSPLSRMGTKLSSMGGHTSCHYKTQAPSQSQASCHLPVNERLHKSLKAGR